MIIWWIGSPAVWLTLSVCVCVRLFAVGSKACAPAGLLRADWLVKTEISLFLRDSSWVDSSELAAHRIRLTVPDCSLRARKWILSVLRRSWSLSVLCRSCYGSIISSLAIVCWNYHQWWWSDERTFGRQILNTLFVYFCADILPSFYDFWRSLQYSDICFT